MIAQIAGLALAVACLAAPLWADEMATPDDYSKVVRGGKLYRPEIGRRYWTTTRIGSRPDIKPPWRGEFRQHPLSDVMIYDKASYNDPAKIGGYVVVRGNCLFDTEAEAKRAMRKSRRHGP